MRMVEVFMAPVMTPQRGQESPSKPRLHAGQIIAIAILSRGESGEFFFGRDALVSHIVEDNLDEAERSLRKRLVAPVNQAQAADHRLRRKRNGLELAGGDLFLT